MEVTLSNRDHPEYGAVTMTFPIPQNQYDACLEQLWEREIGDAVAQDCRVDDITKTLPILACLKGQQVNVDELDFFARCVDVFWGGERYQFEASASVLGLTKIRDLINLTFSMDNVTVIRDFSNLKSLAREHYLHLKGGCAPAEEVDSIDAEKLMTDLIVAGQGQVTPYGVYYGNGMEIQEVYTGKSFPAHTDITGVMGVVLSGTAEPETADDYTLLHFPVPDSYLSRTVIRGGLENEKQIHVELTDEQCPLEALDVIGDNHTVTLDSGFLQEVNALCRVISTLSNEDRNKLGAVIQFAQPNNVRQLIQLAENLGMFEFVPDVKTPEEYGRHLLRNSGIGGDEKLGAFFDFEGYGKEQVRLYDGAFNERGYVALHASITLEELMMDDLSGPEIESAPQERLAAASPKKGKSHRRPER